MTLLQRLIFALVFCGIAILCLVSPAQTQTTPPVVSTICGPSNPAPISGSTGAQGVLDPTNTDPTLGLVWPAGAVSAYIYLESGQVTFLDAGQNVVGNAVIPGVSGVPAFPDGKLNFISVHLPPGTALGPLVTSPRLGPPIIILSCQDVILDAGSNMTVGANSHKGPVPAAFMGADGSSLPNFSGAGFGPRSGSLPAGGSLYPPIGGGGGNSAGTLAGGSGGPAIVIAAAQRITANGWIAGSGLAAAPGSSLAQGGGGGSVRLEGLLVEGVGGIGTGGGPDSDGVVRSASGPIEIQAFLQGGDQFTGTTTTTPIRGNAPVQPIPDNLPVISVDQVNTSTPVFQQFGFTNTGSLTTPDVTLLTPSTAQTDVLVSMSTQLIRDGTIVFVRAVGTDGSVSTATATLSGAAAAANLTLNAGATYQIVATPNTPFPSLGNNPLQFSALSGGQGIGASVVVNVTKETQTVLVTSASAISVSMKMFGMPDPDVIAYSGFESSSQ